MLIWSNMQHSINSSQNSHTFTITSFRELDNQIQTRLPSNLRPTTHECVHLVMCGHFWSRDKDGGHTIQSAMPENPMLHANMTALCLMQRELLPIKVLHCRNRHFRPFWLLWPWPWPDDLLIQTRPKDHGDTTHMQTWISYIKAFESYCLTDTYI